MAETPYNSNMDIDDSQGGRLLNDEEKASGDTKNNESSLHDDSSAHLLGNSDNKTATEHIKDGQNNQTQPNNINHVDSKHFTDVSLCDNSFSSDEEVDTTNSIYADDLTQSASNKTRLKDSKDSPKETKFYRQKPPPVPSPPSDERENGHTPQKKALCRIAATRPISLRGSQLTSDNKDDSSSANQHAGDSSPVLEGGWGWMCVLGFVLGQMMFGMLVRTFGVMVLNFQQRYEASATDTAWVGAINIFVAGTFAPFMSALIVRFSCRSVTIGGGLVLFLSLVVTAVSPNLIICYFSFGVVSGIGLCIAQASGYFMINEYFNKRKGLATGVATVGNGIACFIFPPVIVKMFDDFGYRGCILILAAISANVCVGGALYRPARKKRQVATIKTNNNQRSQIYKGNSKLIIEENKNHDKNCDTKEPSKEVHTHSNNKKQAPKRPPLFNFKLFLRPEYSSFMLVMFFTGYCLGCSSGYLFPLAMDNGVDRKKAAFLMSISGVSSIFGNVLGFIMDMSIIKPRRDHVFNLACFMTGVFVFFMPLSSSFIGYAVIMAMFGMFGTFASAQRNVVITDLVGRANFPSAFGMTLLIWAVGTFFGRIIPGAFRDNLASYNGAFYLGGVGTMAVCVLQSLTLIMVAKRRKKQSVQKYMESIMNNKA